MIKMNEIECEACIKRKTMYCPNSSECFETDDKPHWENRITLLEKYSKLQNNWNELKKWLEVTIKQYDNVGLKFKKESNFECASRSYDYLKQYQTMLDKMQELEGNNE